MHERDGFRRGVMPKVLGNNFIAFCVCVVFSRGEFVLSRVFFRDFNGRGLRGCTYVGACPAIGFPEYLWTPLMFHEDFLHAYALTAFNSPKIEKPTAGCPNPFTRASGTKRQPSVRMCDNIHTGLG